MKRAAHHVRSKRGQAALEFLTTYGWAFLIILVMIGAISYFGILNPAQFLPARCTSSPEFSCTDYRIQSTGAINLVLKQSIGKTIVFENITCTYNDVTVTGSAPAANTYWSPKSSITTICTIPSALATMQGEKVKVLFDITYRQSIGGLTHTAAGEVFAEVQ